MNSQAKGSDLVDYRVQATDGRLTPPVIVAPSHSRGALVVSDHLPQIFR